jgi:hypothetical protein
MSAVGGFDAAVVCKPGDNVRTAPEVKIVTDPKYRVEVHDARNIAIGENNTIYQYILDEGYAPLGHKLISFTALVEEKTRDFVGRQFVVEELAGFMASVPSGYFIIKGEAGIGKSALIANLVKTKQYVHHFVIGPQGINRVDQFLENVCAQLIAKYKLKRPAFLPPEASRDSAFLSLLLDEVSQCLTPGRHVVILVDALDEVDWRGRATENVLFLPPMLPPGVFIVATMRHKVGLSLQVDASQALYLDPASPDNQRDVTQYIIQFAEREAMQSRLLDWGATLDAFVQTMLAKSEGNFMYLRYVLPAVERGEFRYGTLNEMPQGLKSYYERHWRQIRAIDEEMWVTYRQPVICYLAAAMEPATIWQIADWSKIAPARVLAAIRDWREFLDEETTGEQKRYRIYHASFQDFLADKDEAKEINLRQTHSTVANELLRRWDSINAHADEAIHLAAEVRKTDYVRGLQRLQVLIDRQAPELLADFSALEVRMLKILSAETRNGSHETYRDERQQVVTALNDLASQAALPSNYNQLCGGEIGK